MNLLAKKKDRSRFFVKTGGIPTPKKKKERKQNKPP